MDTVTDESGATNNCSSTASVFVRDPSKADLAMVWTIVGRGANMGMSLYVQNIGGVAFPSVTPRFNQPTDSTISAADTELGTSVVPARTSNNRSIGS